MTWIGIVKGLVRWVLRLGKSRLLSPVLSRMGSAGWVGNSIRIRALRAAGISIGAGVQVGSHVQFGADNLVLGKGSVVGDHVKFVGVAHIHVPMNSTLDANSSIGDVRISTGGSGLAIHYPVTATGKVPGVGRPPRIGGAETAAGEAGHGTN